MMLDHYTSFVDYGMVVVGEEGVAALAALGCSDDDCLQQDRLESGSSARLPQRSAAAFVSEYSCPCMLQKIEHRDTAKLPVVLPFAGAFALTPRYPVYPSSIV